jgi:ABC-2 type transport system permease protein
MSGFFVMLKCNLKLVFRNKSAILLILLIPLASTLILKVPTAPENFDDSLLRTKVIVFDNSSTALSRELIDLLKSNKSFNIKLDQGTIEDLNSAKEKSVNLANRSSTNGFVFIPSDFSDSIMKGNTEDVITIFSTGTDDRVKVLENNINMILLRFNMYSKVASGNKVVFDELMKKDDNNKTEGEIIPVTSGGKVLNSTEKSKLTNFGYLVAILSITLMFSGNFISSIFIDEKSNRVLKRITLTKSSLVNYGMVKMLVALVALIVQVSMIILGIKLFVNLDVGINLFQIALLVFGLGLIFNTLSIALGAIFENLSNSNYFAFFITTISAMMSGLYFPIDITPKWMQNASLIMPQRWVIKTAEKMLLQANEGVILFGVIVLAYMALMLTVGFLGLKLNSD